MDRDVKDAGKKAIQKLKKSLLNFIYMILHHNINSSSPNYIATQDDTA